MAVVGADVVGEQGVGPAGFSELGQIGQNYGILASCLAGGGLRGEVTEGGHAEADAGVPAGDQRVDQGEAATW